MTEYEKSLELFSDDKSLLWYYWWFASKKSQEYRKTDEWRIGKVSGNDEEFCIKATFRGDFSLIR